MIFYIYVGGAGVRQSTYVELLLSFHHMGSNDLTQIIGLGNKCLCPQCSICSLLNLYEMDKLLKRSWLSRVSYSIDSYKCSYNDIFCPDGVTDKPSRFLQKNRILILHKVFLKINEYKRTRPKFGLANFDWTLRPEEIYNKKKPQTNILHGTVVKLRRNYF